MLDLFKAFTTKEDFFYDGAFIAKVKYQRFQPKSESESYKIQLVKNNRRLCIIDCNGYINNELAETLTVYLMMNVTAKESAPTSAVEDSGTIWRTFSKEEIADFSHLTGDTNSIHLTENPVVQGLFILKELYATVKTYEIEVKYVHPVYGCNPVYIKHEGNQIMGYSKNALCFTATIS